MADVCNIDRLLLGTGGDDEEFSHSPATWQPPDLERARVFAAASSEISKQFTPIEHISLMYSSKVFAYHASVFFLSVLIALILEPRYIDWC
jgi:hypothetical protein